MLKNTTRFSPTDDDLMFRSRMTSQGRINTDERVRRIREKQEQMIWTHVLDIFSKLDPPLVVNKKVESKTTKFSSQSFSHRCAFVANSYVSLIVEQFEARDKVRKHCKKSLPRPRVFVKCYQRNYVPELSVSLLSIRQKLKKRVKSARFATSEVCIWNNSRISRILSWIPITRILKRHWVHLIEY